MFQSYRSYFGRWSHKHRQLHLYGMWQFKQYRDSGECDQYRNQCFLKLVQPKKALVPILVTLAGITILLKLPHSVKVELPMLVTPSPKVTSVRLEHWLKA